MSGARGGIRPVGRTTDEFAPQTRQRPPLLDRDADRRAEIAYDANGNRLSAADGTSIISTTTTRLNRPLR